MTNPTAPTRIRWIILALTVCIAVLLYLDRFCLGYVTPYLKEGLGLTSGETGFMLGAFFYTYAIGQIPAGWMADRYGVRWMLSLYLAVWSVMTGLIGFADGFILLLLLRFGCGLFEAGCYPACAGLIRRWIPYDQRGLASGIVSLGGRIGGAITPAVTGFLIIVFMPVDKPSTVTEGDILDAGKLARMVYQRDESKLPEPIAWRLQAATDRNRGVFAELAALPADGKPNYLQLEACRDIVNRWITLPILFDTINLDTIKPKLNRQALALLDDPETPTNADKTARLNRYILEVLFPDSIRKILGSGWQPVLIIYGGIGVLVALVFVLFYRNTPREHFLTNEAEAQLAEASEVKSPMSETPTPAGHLWRSILTDVSLWASSIVQFGTNFGWIIIGNQLASYLADVHQVPEGAERGLLASLPFLVALPTLIIGGYWTDWMTKRYGPRIGRAFPIVSTRFATALAFAVCPFLDGAWPVVIVLCVMSIVHDMGLPAIWGYNLDVGKRNVGVVLGWGNMWGNLGAAVSSNVLVPLTGMFATKKAGYDAVFLVCAGVFVAIGFVSLLIDASKPLGEQPPPPATPLPETGVRTGEPPIRPTNETSA